MTANTAASSVEMASTISAGCLRAIRMPVTSGTTSNQGVRLNVPASASEYWAICTAGVPSCARPSTVKMMSAITMDGTVVIIR